MELYNVIAQWAGWPMVVALMILGGGYAYMILNKHISIITQERDFLERQLQEAKQFSPDLVLQRLRERHKDLSEEIERLLTEKDVDKELITKLANEKSKVTQEMSHSILVWLQSILARAENRILEPNNVAPETEIIVNDIIDDIIEASNKFLPNN